MNNTEKPVGGFAFFSSLAALLVLIPINFLILSVLIDRSSLARCLCFATGIAVGFFFASLLIRGHLATLMHELKHSVVSNLCGNRSKSMRIEKDSGNFEYSYTKGTAHLNAIIALAPYFFPLLTLATIFLSLAFLPYPIIYIIILIGVGYGADLSLALRDLGPHQTDLTTIRGGYAIGLIYVVLMNLFLLSLLIAWCCDGIHGLSFLGRGLLEFMARLITVHGG